MTDRILCVAGYPDSDMGYGYGYGNGYGNGEGSGSGYGFGSGSGGGRDGDDSGFGNGEGYGSDEDSGGNRYGDGYGSGDDNGYGYGNGYGNGDGITSINGERIYQIDDVPTLIDSVHGNYAKGRILQSDLTTRPCYVARVGNYFAHGDTLRQAMDDAQSKYDENRPLEELIADFNAEFPDRDVKVDAARLFQWHHVLTGSCLMGRKQFCEERGLDYEHGHYTVNEFIAPTRNAYGGHIIRLLEKNENVLDSRSVNLSKDDGHLISDDYDFLPF